MEIFLFWLGLSVAVAFYASKKGRSSIGWFFLAVLISPVLAGIFLAIAKDLTAPTLPQDELGNPITPSTHVYCPDCRELVRKEARKCKHCGSSLIPQ